VTALGAGGLALVGFVVGGFVNLLVDRVPQKRPLLPLGGGCLRCVPAPGEGVEPGRPVGAVLWPVRGRRCPACGRSASARYPVVQLLTAAAFAGVGLRFGADWAVPAYLVFFTSLLAVSLIDLDLHIIPNRIVYPTIFASVPLLGVAAVAQGDPGRLGRALLGAAVAWVSLFVIHLVSPAGMGFGDVRLSFVLGLFLGWLELRSVLTGLFLGFLLGSVLGVVLIVVRLRGRRDHIPFGPFLAGGAVLTVFFGDVFNGWVVGT
jgi:leader peptidase (prepilin peptidase) / N-methyltransferase